MVHIKEVLPQYTDAAAKLLAKQCLPEDATSQQIETFVGSCAEKMGRAGQWHGIAWLDERDQTNAATEAGIDPRRCIFPSEVRIFGIGLIEFIAEEGSSSSVYVGEGNPPTLLSEFKMQPGRIAHSPFAMMLNSHIYTPVTAGQSYPESYADPSSHRLGPETAEYDGFIYADISNVIAQRCVEAVRDTRHALLGNNSPINFTNFVSAPSGYNCPEHQNYAAKPGVQMPVSSIYDYGISLSPDKTSGYTMNDGHGHLSIFRGPYSLVKLGENERVYSIFSYNDEDDSLIVGEPGDYLAVMPGKRPGTIAVSIITADLVKSEQVDVYEWQEGKINFSKLLMEGRSPEVRTAWAAETGIGAPTSVIDEAQGVQEERKRGKNEPDTPSL